eukprot:760014-Rhodomonas_salina.1
MCIRDSRDADTDTHKIEIETRGLLTRQRQRRAPGSSIADPVSVPDKAYRRRSSIAFAVPHSTSRTRSSIAYASTIANVGQYGGARPWKQVREPAWP